MTCGARLALTIFPRQIEFKRFRKKGSPWLIGRPPVEIPLECLRSFSTCYLSELTKEWTLTLDAR